MANTDSSPSRAVRQSSKRPIDDSTTSGDAHRPERKKRKLVPDTPYTVNEIMEKLGPLPPGLSLREMQNRRKEAIGKVRAECRAQQKSQAHAAPPSRSYSLAQAGSPQPSCPSIAPGNRNVPSASSQTLANQSIPQPSSIPATSSKSNALQQESVSGTDSDVEEVPPPPQVSRGPPSIAPRQMRSRQLVGSSASVEASVESRENRVYRMSSAQIQELVDRVRREERGCIAQSISEGQAPHQPTFFQNRNRPTRGFGAAGPVPITHGNPATQPQPIHFQPVRWTSVPPENHDPGSYPLFPAHPQHHGHGEMLPFVVPPGLHSFGPTPSCLSSPPTPMALPAPMALPTSMAPPPPMSPPTPMARPAPTPAFAQPSTPGRYTFPTYPIPPYPVPSNAPNAPYTPNTDPSSSSYMGFRRF